MTSHITFNNKKKISENADYEYYLLLKDGILRINEDDKEWMQNQIDTIEKEHPEYLI